MANEITDTALRQLAEGRLVPSAARAFATEVVDPFLLVAMAQRTFGADAALRAIDAASPAATRTRLATGRDAIHAWLSGTTTRDHADAAFADVDTEDRRWVALMYLCADLANDAAGATEVMAAYAGGMVENDEIEFDTVDITRLRDSLFP